MTKVQNEPMKPSGDAGSLSAVDQRKRLLITQIISAVRMYLRDYQQLNRLVKGEEHSDRQIGSAFMMALDQYNITPPLTGQIGVLNIPSVDLFVRGTVAHLLRSSALVQLRNRMVYSDGQGTRVNQTTNAELYNQWATMLEQQWKQDVREYKIAANIDNVVDDGAGVRSEYLLLSGFDE